MEVLLYCRRVSDVNLPLWGCGCVRCESGVHGDRVSIKVVLNDCILVYLMLTYLYGAVVVWGVSQVYTATVSV